MGQLSSIDYNHAPVITMDLPTVETHTILRGVVGSTVHGLNVQDSIEDRDEMGVCIEPMRPAMGVHAPFEQLVYRTATERTGRHDAPSQANDLDLTIYSLRKYVRLALKGNPTVLLLLYIPNPTVLTGWGERLRNHRDNIISRRAGECFLGYLHAQRQRLLGERGNGGHGQPRRALIERFGFDTKFAMHMLRLGFQGVELMSTGWLSLPMQEPERSFLLDVRNGKIALNACLTVAGELEAKLNDLRHTSPLRQEPDERDVETLMLEMYKGKWEGIRP